MTPVQILVSQFQAALAMLNEAVTACPDAIWNDPGDKVKFWHIAYHALFYTHLYLQESERAFVPWSKHREGYNVIGQPSQGSPSACDADPYDKNTILEYLDLCRRQVAERVPQLDPDGHSGFYWLPMSKLELQIYTIRHIQQHTGELMERLGARAGIEIDWVGVNHGSNT